VYQNVGQKLPPAPGEVKMGKWSYIGPVEFDEKKGFEFPHPAEKMNLKETYVGKAGQKITWKQRDFVDGQINGLEDLFAPGFREMVGVYFHRTIEVDAYSEIPIGLGSDDTLTVWIDGQKIISAPGYRACTPDSNKAILKLEPGKHDLLIKVCQYSGGFAYCFNWTKPERPVAKGVAFEDVTAKVGLANTGTDVKYDSLVVQDVNGTAGLISSAAIGSSSQRRRLRKPSLTSSRKIPA